MQKNSNGDIKMDIAKENIISSKPFSGIKHLQKLRLVLWNLFLITSGSLICALAINGILIPHKFLSGGFVGTTLIIHYLFPFFPVAGLYFVLNIPVYFLGWKYIGKRFFLYSVAGMVIFSLAVLWKPFIIPVHDKMLAAIFAGILSGAGGGIILKSFGSAGGMDILSIILFKRFSSQRPDLILYSLCIFDGRSFVHPDIFIRFNPGAQRGHVWSEPAQGRPYYFASLEKNSQGNHRIDSAGGDHYRWPGRLYRTGYPDGVHGHLTPGTAPAEKAD
jgi:hypothetical protein